MKQYTLRPFVLPTIYILAIATIIFSIVLVGQQIRDLRNQDLDYVVGAIVDDTTPVVTETKKDEKVIKPFVSEKVVIVKDFYEKDAPEDKQKNSIIYFENTYMQNSGILYKADEAFDVVAVMDGVVSNIKEDKLLGMVIEIDHGTKLKTIYQSLTDIKVTVGQAVKQGDVIGVSGPNSINKESEFQLLFEVSHNGKLINPSKFYGTDVKTYQE
jgi:stage II sporulation protein Q